MKPSKKQHDCGSPKYIWDSREDALWHPPEQEVRPRCVNCGWLGRWEKVTPPKF